MQPELANILRCLDLQERHIAEAIVGREQTKALLAHLARISAPDTGVAKVLLIYARMATTACDWVDGDLSIDLADNGDATIVSAFTELGGGLRERLFGPMRFSAPLDEFARAITRVPRMISPLKKRSTARLIRLSAAEVIRRTTAPPPAVNIAAESLFLRSRRDYHVPDEPSPPPSGPVSLPVVGRDHARPGGDRAPNAAVRGESVPPIEDVDAGWDD
ncbi:MAG TPA: hypothetical protein VEK07_04335 [Polyangiaceae bacterium]|nr:hypothetical protein [Polyangiaceae bacterium]